MVCQSAPPASSPAPRLRAFSMLSLGTELFFAFCMSSYSVRLHPRSPPPTRAATSMFLINRANILPRRASTTAFLCLVVAHLEWPLMGYYLAFLAVFLAVFSRRRNPTSLRGARGRNLFPLRLGELVANQP